MPADESVYVPPKPQRRYCVGVMHALSARVRDLERDVSLGIFFLTYQCHCYNHAQKGFPLPLREEKTLKWAYYVPKTRAAVLHRGCVLDPVGCGNGKHFVAMTLEHTRVILLQNNSATT